MLWMRTVFSGTPPLDRNVGYHPQRKGLNLTIIEVYVLNP
jgi:hypothetical protein